MQTLTPQQTEHINGAGSIDSALMRWYLYTLTTDGVARAVPPGSTEF